MVCPNRRPSVALGAQIPACRGPTDHPSERVVADNGVRQKVPIRPAAQHLHAFFPALAVQEQLVRQHHELHAEDLFDHADDMIDLLAHLDVPRHLTVDPPGVHETQSIGAQRSQLNAPRRVPSVDGPVQRGVLDHIAVAVRIVHAQETDAVQIVKIEMRDLALGRPFVEQGFRIVQQCGPVAGEPAPLQLAIPQQGVHDAPQQAGIVHATFPQEQLGAPELVVDVSVDAAFLEPVDAAGKDRQQDQDHQDDGAQDRQSDLFEVSRLCTQSFLLT